MSATKRFEIHEQPEPETIEVSESDEWKITKAPHIIETTGLGPCIGVIIYDPQSKNAMVGHFADPRPDNLEGMLDEAIKTFPDTTKIKIYVGGGSPELCCDPHLTNDKAIKNFVKQQLEAHGFQDSQITTHYLSLSNETTIMRIDTSTGVVEYDDDDTDQDNM